MKHWVSAGLAAALLALGMAAVLGGCGSNSASPGRAAVYLTDAASATYSAVNVTIESVEIHQAGRWVSVNGDFPVVVDLLTLQYQQHLLGTVPLSEGQYTQTRMILSDEAGANTVTLLSDSSTHDVEVPSGPQTGIKLIGGYSVEAGRTTAIVIDFDPDKTIHLTGSDKYVLRPTIPLIVQQQALDEYGALAGAIEPEAAWETAVVSAYDAASDLLVASCAVTFPPLGETPQPTDGTFRIALPGGTYYLKATATGYDPFDSRPTTYVVDWQADTDAGTITLTPTP